jgi:hypothetical protein
MCQSRGSVSFGGMFESDFGMMLTMFVVSLAAFLRRRFMALCGFFMGFRRGVVRFNYVVFFVHDVLLNSSYPDDPGLIWQ